MLIAIVSLTACNEEETKYTLYRNSMVIPNGRLHVATFDANYGDAQQSASYNNENCLIARDLFQSQPDVIVNYWCEKGAFKE